MKIYLGLSTLLQVFFQNTAIAGGFVNVCERSPAVRAALEAYIQAPCSDIDAGDLDRPNDSRPLKITTSEDTRSGKARSDEEI